MAHTVARRAFLSFLRSSEVSVVGDGVFWGLRTKLLLQKGWAEVGTLHPEQAASHGAGGPGIIISQIGKRRLCEADCLSRGPRSVQSWDLHPGRSDVRACPGHQHTAGQRG